MLLPLGKKLKFCCKPPFEAKSCGAGRFISASLASDHQAGQVKNNALMMLYTHGVMVDRLRLQLFRISQCTQNRVLLQVLLGSEREKFGSVLSEVKARNPRTTFRGLGFRT